MPQCVPQGGRSAKGSGLNAGRLLGLSRRLSRRLVAQGKCPQYEQSQSSEFISSIVPDPSLHWVCICKSPFKPAAVSEFSSRVRRASGKVRNPFRIAGGDGISVEASIQLWMRRLKVGPIPGSSVSERPSWTINAVSSGHKNALRDARRSAF